MINQFWEKPYNRDEAVITVKDWNQYLAPNIQSEISTQLGCLKTEIDQISNKYVRLSDYQTLQLQYMHLQYQYNETMEILATKGILTEEDIKEFRDSRKLAKTMAEPEAPDNFAAG